MIKTSMKIALAIVSYSLFSMSGAQATVIRTGIDDAAAVKSVSIHFLAGVSTKSVAELISAIQNVNASYRNAKKIDLFINSGGGDADSGFAAYWAVKNSKIPVRTINSSFVASAATAIFCGGRERFAFSNAYYLMHPASIGGAVAVEYKPDQFLADAKILDMYNLKMKGIYKSCFDIGEAELDEMLSSEGKRKLFDANDAEKMNLSKVVTDYETDSDVNYSIHDGTDD